MASQVLMNDITMYVITHVTWIDIHVGGFQTRIIAKMDAAFIVRDLGGSGKHETP